MGAAPEPPSTGPADGDGVARPDPSGLAEAAGGFALGVVLSAVGASIGAVGTGYHGAGGSPTPLGVTLGGVVGLWVGLLGAVVVVARRAGAGPTPRAVAGWVGLRVAGVWDLIGGGAAGLVSQYLLVPLLYLPAEQFDPGLAHRLSAPAQQDTGAVHGPLAALVLVLVLVVGAPLVEEVFFRGLVLRGLSARAGPVAGVVVTALLFALAHFQALQFAGLAAFGLVLGVLARRGRRLGPSVAAHAAFNAAAVASLIHLH